MVTKYYYPSYMFPTPQSRAKHRVLKITEIASLCPKTGTEHPPAYKTFFFLMVSQKCQQKHQKTVLL